MNAADTLALARADLHDAARSIGDPRRRRQCARSAADYAAEVVLAPDASPSQRDSARCHLDEALRILDAT